MNTLKIILEAARKSRVLASVEYLQGADGIKTFQPGLVDIIQADVFCEELEKAMGEEDKMNKARRDVEAKLRRVLYCEKCNLWFIDATGLAKHILEGCTEAPKELEVSLDCGHAIKKGGVSVASLTLRGHRLICTDCANETK